MRELRSPVPLSTGRPTRASARRSSACWSSRCRRRRKSWISSWRRCCAISSWSSRPMRLSASELSRFGEELGAQLNAPAVIGLSGELGTGKTTLVQAICRGLGARDLGFDDMTRERAIILIEWPERAGPWAPPLDRHFQLSYDVDPSLRILEEPATV